MPTPTPSTLTSLLEWPSFLQAEKRLNHLLGRCSLSEREHAELQYFSYLIARIRSILDTTPEGELPTEFNKLLHEVHKLTEGTEFSYAANPDSFANSLLYDIFFVCGDNSLLSNLGLGELLPDELLGKIKVGTYEGREALSASHEVFTQHIDKLFLNKVNRANLMEKLRHALSSDMTPDGLKQSLPIFNQLSEREKSRLFVDVVGSPSCGGLLKLIRSISVESLDYLINRSSVAHSFARHLGETFGNLNSLVFILKNIDSERWKSLIQSPYIRKSMVDAISSDNPWLGQLLDIVDGILDQDGIGEVAEAAEELWAMLPALNSPSGGKSESIEEVDRNLCAAIAKLLAVINDEQKLAVTSHLLEDSCFISRNALDILRKSFVHMPNSSTERQSIAKKIDHETRRLLLYIICTAPKGCPDLAFFERPYVPSECPVELRELKGVFDLTDPEAKFDVLSRTCERLEEAAGVFDASLGYVVRELRRIVDSFAPLVDSSARDERSLASPTCG